MDSWSFEPAPVARISTEPSWIGNTYDTSAAVDALWLGLIRGKFTVVEASITRDSAGLSLRAVPEHARGAGHEGAARIFEAVIRGKLQKVVAIDGGISPSSV